MCHPDSQSEIIAVPVTGPDPITHIRGLLDDLIVVISATPGQVLQAEN